MKGQGMDQILVEIALDGRIRYALGAVHNVGLAAMESVAYQFSHRKPLNQPVLQSVQRYKLEIHLLRKFSLNVR